MSATRQNPAKAAEAPEGTEVAAKERKAPKAPARYHIYDAAKLKEALIGDYMGKRADEAVAAFIQSGDHPEIASAVENDGLAIAVVPDRNLTVVSAQVETKTKVKFSSASA